MSSGHGYNDFPVDGITLAGLLQDPDDFLRGHHLGRPANLAPILEEHGEGDGEDESGIVLAVGEEEDEESLEGGRTGDVSEGAIVCYTTYVYS